MVSGGFTCGGLEFVLEHTLWNLNYWDSISTLAGEVDNPKRPFRKRCCTGAVPLHRDKWTDGYFSDVAKIIGGVWLQWWVQAGAAMSNMGMFVTEMSSDSFQLLGMAERGMIPEFFAKRSRHGTPTLGILFSASGVILFSRLRMKYPAASRPYKIPVGTVGSILLCVPPTILFCVVLSLSSLKVMIFSVIAIFIGFALQPILKFSEKKRWLKFSTKADLPDLLNTHEHKESLVY
ncbi:putative amino acid/polyamine transporter I [Helianthus annuus]|nr:putative amino acid/polyamine transporter I [Helianthus annuus]